MKNSIEFNMRETLYLDLLRKHELLSNGASIEPWRLWLSMFSPRFSPVLIYRLAYKCQSCNLGFFAKLLSLINFIIFGIEIATVCRIGPGLFFPHTQGTVIGAISIGNNAVIYQNVTIGAKDINFTYDKFHRPTIGNNTFIGAGAKVLGGITIGNSVTIAANSVAIKSIDDHSVVAGIPAKVISVNGIRQ